MSKTIGVIGLGSIGMRHVKNLMELDHKVRGYDPQEKDPEIQVSRYDVCKDSDAIIIATPTAEHLFDLDLAQEYGKPIFMEKPMGTSMPLHGIEHLAMVGYNLRFHECVQQAQDWIAEDLVGQILWANLVCAQYNDKPAYLRDGVILNWSHEVDLALYLLGPAKVAASSTRLTDGKDDLTDIILEHDSGCRSTIHLDYLTNPEIRQTIIVGEKATVIMDLVGRQAWLRDVSGNVIDAFVAQDSWDQNYMDEMKAFVARIDGEETLGATGEDGLRALEVCLEVRKRAGLK